MENFRFKVFRAVAEALSFRQAAESLYLTQPAVTQQIKALEDEVGLQLFDRSGSRVSLTPGGRTLLARAREIAAIVDVAEREIAALKGVAQGDLHIGASTTIAQYLLPRLLVDFTRAHPGIRLSVIGANTAAVVASVVEGRVALGLIEGPSLRRDLKTERFLADTLAVIAPAHHEWKDLVVTTEMLSRSRLILREQGSGTRRVVEAALRQAGARVTRANVVMELDSTEAIKSAVEAGLGVGFVPHRAIHNALTLGTLVEVHVRGLRIERHFSIVQPQGSQPAGPAAAFLRFARQVRDSGDR